MKKLITTLAIILIGSIASATPFILVQAEEIRAILSDFSALSSGSAVLSSIKLLKDSSLRTYEIETVGFDNSELVCKVHVQAVFVKKDPYCLPPPGGRCDGEYRVRLVSKTCEKGHQ